METNISGIVNPAKIKCSTGTDCNYLTFILQLGLLTSLFCGNAEIRFLLWEHMETWGVDTCKTVQQSLPPDNSWLWILDRPQTLSLLQIILITPVMIHYIIYSPKFNHSISHFLPCRHVLLYFTHGFQLLFIVAFKSYFSTVRSKTSHFII